MNKNRLFQAGILFFALLAVVLLASCTQDEIVEQSMSLPEGLYPITFSVSQVGEGGVQTRVSDYEENGTHKSRWTEGDKIKVKVGDMETVCTLDGNGNIISYSPQLYWQNTNDVNVSAWYSNISGQSTVEANTVSLTDQSQNLAYVLKASTTANYNSGNIALNFSHQLAKVRMKLEKLTYSGNMNVTEVKVKGYTTCTVSDGAVTGSGDESYISMHKNGDYYEADLAPGTTLQTEAFEISADGKTTQANLKSAVSLAAGNLYTLNITMNAAGTQTVNLSTLTGPYTINDTGVYLLTGNTTQNITISSDADVYLKDANINVNSGNGISITGGNPTIHVVGTNTVKSSNGAGIYVAENSTVTITGDSRSDLLTVTGNKGSSGIGGYVIDDSKYTSANCGHIRINNVTVYAYK